MILKEESLLYHRSGKYGPNPGKIEVVVSKPCNTADELSMAYTPGVAEPCLAIEQNPDLAYEYTIRGNLVAVVSNGTAVLGLGNIGALAGKPVMEGKGVLFKAFGKVDVFDIELDTLDPDEIIRAVQMMEPTFGGINLEDIKAPECFYIEEKLIETMKIPVFHDDQHGTAIISGAGLLNALEITNKKIEEIRVVFCGAGAAGIACAKFYESLGVQRENMLLVDTKGVVHEGRINSVNKYKAMFATKGPERTLEDAMRGADVFTGVSVAGLVTPDMLRSMNKDPIVFAMANPNPEITYDDAVNTRSDVIMATGRSDYPNQINNVLGFPFIFRGALDVRAGAISEGMKVAAAKSLAALAKEPVIPYVVKAYGGKEFTFGRQYIVPKPFDPRVYVWESYSVAEAAVKEEIAKIKDFDLAAYRKKLEADIASKL